MDELGEVVERSAAELNEMLALEVSLSALAGDGGYALRAVLRKRGDRLGVEESVVDGVVAARNDADLVAQEIQGACEADGIGRHRVGPCLVQDVTGGADLHGDPQRELVG